MAETTYLPPCGTFTGTRVDDEWGVIQDRTAMGLGRALIGTGWDAQAAIASARRGQGDRVDNWGPIKVVYRKVWFSEWHDAEVSDVPAEHSPECNPLCGDESHWLLPDLDDDQAEVAREAKRPTDKDGDG